MGNHFHDIYGSDMQFTLDDRVQVSLDKEERVRRLRHVSRPYLSPEGAIWTPREMADAYLHTVADIYGFEEDWLESLHFDPELVFLHRLQQRGDFPNLPFPFPRDLNSSEHTRRLALSLDARGESLPRALAGVRLWPSKGKAGEEPSPLIYFQTWNGLPVWEAGISVGLLEDPLRVIGSASTIDYDLRKRTPEWSDLAQTFREEAKSSRLADLLDDFFRHWLHMRPFLGSWDLVLYRYDSERRLDEIDAWARDWLRIGELRGDFESSRYYAGISMVFSHANPEDRDRPTTWRVILDIQTGGLLYLRGLFAGVSAQIYRTDPISASNDKTLTHTEPASRLNPLRSAVTLSGLQPPAAGQPQFLHGSFVTLQTGQNSAPSTVPPNGHFTHDVPTSGFAAVNAYHHCDAFFRLVRDLGFDMNKYFDGTVWPVRVLHWVQGGQPPAAFMFGNSTGDGCDRFEFGPVDHGSAVGLGADARVMAHEFGHAVLIDHLHQPCLPFAHSVGDILGFLYTDPDSATHDALTFPFVPGLVGREHERMVQQGWSWGGSHDTPRQPYEQEQILTTTLVRLYRALGGAAAKRLDRRPASHHVLYLILRAIELLPGPGLTFDAEDFANALMDADLGTNLFRGVPGGTVHKVIRWSFEEQGLYRSPSAPATNASGDPPRVDVYLDDGRKGRYEYQAGPASTNDVWNRCQADNGTPNQVPRAGQINYLYVRVSNRGLQNATQTTVRVYHYRPGGNLADPSWPADWTPINLSGLSAPGPVLPGSFTVVGPIPWHPRGAEDCILAVVSDPGDQSNIDPGLLFPCAKGPCLTSALLRGDNNLGCRNLSP